MPARNEELQGIYLGERYRWGNVIISQFRDPGEEIFTVKTSAEPDELLEGLTYTLFGRWSEHDRYGKQFHARSFVQTTPHDKDGIVSYLARAGVSKTVRLKLWDLYGPDAVKRLREEPVRVAKEINSRYLSEEKAWKISFALEEDKRTEDVQIELTGLLAGRGFRRDLIKELINLYGSRAATLIEKNPYLLIQFPGVGFSRADQLYLELGKPPGALKRQTLCMAHAISSNGDGHTWYEPAFLERAVRSRIAGCDCQPVKAAKLGLRARLFAIHREESGPGLPAPPWLTLAGRATVESEVAYAVTALLRRPPRWPDVSSLDVSAHQAQELSRALRARVGIFGGGPGTGKTYSAARLIGAILRRQGLQSVAVCAPTGKAAVRITEALDEHGIALKARTIHSYLGVEGVSGGVWSFSHNEEKPVEEDFVIIDESSMIDISLMSSLVQALPPSSHLLLVGDVNQLPPVGHGAPLRDLLAAGIPAGKLVEIRRNAGAIVKTCAAISEEKHFEIADRIDLEKEVNLALRETQSGRESVNIILECIRRIRKTGLADPTWGTQIVVAVNEKSPLARKELNKLLQVLLNEKNRTDTRYWPDDKIVCLRNSSWPIAPQANRHPEAAEWIVEKDDSEEYYIANGELGKVVVEEKNKLILDFFSPRRSILIPKGKDSEPGEGIPIDLGYAVSCHKSQGSEWPIVVVALDDYPGAKMVCDRSWLYTAISRAKKACLLIGQEATLRGMVKRQKIGQRKTFLVERFAEARKDYETSNSTQNGQAGREAAYDCAVTSTDAMMQHE